MLRKRRLHSLGRKCPGQTERANSRGPVTRLAAAALVRALLPVLVAACNPAPAAAEGSAPARPAVGLDHIPLAVKNLEHAADDFHRLGFTLKAGRLHDNGVRNQHVKFEDGAGIELITASEARDAQTAKYLRLLWQGDGPALLGLHTANVDALAKRLESIGQAYARQGGFVTLTEPGFDYLFFGGSNRSPTDRPEHFAHANTASAMIGVWIAGGDVPRLSRLFASLGAAIIEKQVFVPEKINATVARLENGEITFLPASRQVISGRPIVGAVFKTRDLGRAQRLLASTHNAAPTMVQAAGHRSLFIPPQTAHGIWLELREEQ